MYSGYLRALGQRTRKIPTIDQSSWMYIAMITVLIYLDTRLESKRIVP